MYNSIRDHFEGLRKIEETLPVGKFLYLVSIEDKPSHRVGGVICCVDRANAARCLKADTHRLATDEEAAAHEAEEERKREELRYASLTKFPSLRFRGDCIVLEPKPEPQSEPKKKQGR